MTPNRATPSSPTQPRALNKPTISPPDWLRDWRDFFVSSNLRIVSKTHMLMRRPEKGPFFDTSSRCPKRPRGLATSRADQKIELSKSFLAAEPPWHVAYFAVVFSP